MPDALMIAGLPAGLGRDPLPGDAGGAAAAAGGPALATVPLDGGVPALLPLRDGLALALGVPLGRARALLDLDPGVVVVGSGAVDVGAGQLRPRITLTSGSTPGDTVAIVPGTTRELAVAGSVAVRLVVGDLQITAGSLRGPGRYGSWIRLGWELVGPADDRAPDAAVGDPSIPRRPVISLLWRRA